MLCDNRLALIKVRTREEGSGSQLQRTCVGIARLKCTGRQRRWCVLAPSATVPPSPPCLQSWYHNADPLAAATWFYLLYFSAIVSIGPFLNVHFARIGLTNAQLGVLSALRPWLSAPAGFAWSALADRLHSHRAVLVLALAASTALRSTLVLPRSFWGILALALASEAVTAPVSIMADAAVVAACKKVTGYTGL